ncbi:aminotransferase class IV family protein [Janthinobacterium psychrotolerans]|uniref:Branched-chain amino acid aminotransferase/4-amino-4-deoxychorismate lyase n=1 Tax=Janthinobacterium psychrotolerans TaxID=1747903 RepID=A0A1A7C020_9BURK|nr:aminotransferase class IV family protein [Janthinobacterium psychrotolerans]OBV39097.1 Branched-chain amino acid aminotransferase/4-amino-4-deoxychorismate lyase [Janthinobacterium psychrotolerans]
MSVVQLNGVSATIADLAPLAFAGYAHFTAMQVRGGQVRGLDLHLARLRGASLQLFNMALPDDMLRGYLRAALAASPADCSLTLTLYCPAGEFAVAAVPVLPQVLVRTAPPSSGPQGPLRLAAVEHERLLPAIKHVGEIAKTWYLRQAAAQGLDDAAFVDRQGRLSEGTIWNLAFWDGHGVVWPQAAMLGGTMMAMVRRQLAHMQVPQREEEITLAGLSAMQGAVVMNSWTPGVAVHEIGGVSLPPAPELLGLLHRAHQAEALLAP